MIFKVYLPDEVVLFLKRIGYDPKSYLMMQINLLVEQVKKDIENKILEEHREKIKVLEEFIKSKVKVESEEL